MILYSLKYSSYRFGFQGQEKDDEVFGSTGTSYTAEFWQYDSRLGRRWNVDPVDKPWESSYATFANNPIWFTDVLGLDTVAPEEFKTVGDDVKTEDGTVITPNCPPVEIVDNLPSEFKPYGNVGKGTPVPGQEGDDPQRKPLENWEPNMPGNIIEELVDMLMQWWLEPNIEDPPDKPVIKKTDTEDVEETVVVDEQVPYYVNGKGDTIPYKQMNPNYGKVIDRRTKIKKNDPDTVKIKYKGQERWENK